jgi:hypothetical protein
MGPSERLRADLEGVMAGAAGPVESADRLCHACVDLLRVDGAAISYVHHGTSRGTFGSSGELSRRWDQYQFTFGEGPCLDAVRQGRPVLAGDLQDPKEVRWPAFTGAMLGDGVRGVFAFPVRVAATRIGALDLFRRTPGAIDSDVLDGAGWASQLAALPLLDLMSADVDWETIGEGGGWSQLESLERVEVYQATGMIQEQLDVDATEALIRLRGYAFSHDMTISEVAWAIVERQLSLGPDDFGTDPDGTATSPL